MAERRKKLIEVALPLEALGNAVARDTLIRHGHPCTGHSRRRKAAPMEIEVCVAIGVGDGDVAMPRYIRKPFQREPDFAVTSVNYDLNELLARSLDPN